MPARPTRPRRLALALAAVTAVTLGTISASAAHASGGDTTAPRAPVTSRPVAYEPTADAPGDVNAANDAFAACMRGRGETTFPEFHASQDAEGHIALRIKMRVTGDGFDPTSSAYRKAVKACAPILKEAGISFPANGGDLPQPPNPKEPGNHDDHGKHNKHGKHERGKDERKHELPSPKKPGQPEKPTTNGHSGTPALTRISRST
jgi:hypothetical protein